MSFTCPVCRPRQRVRTIYNRRARPCYDRICGGQVRPFKTPVRPSKTERERVRRALECNGFGARLIRETRREIRSVRCRPECALNCRLHDAQQRSRVRFTGAGRVFHGFRYVYIRFADVCKLRRFRRRRAVGGGGMGEVRRRREHSCTTACRRQWPRKLPRHKRDASTVYG